MNSSTPTWRDLQQAADQARMAAAHDRAIALYSAALAQPDVPWDAICALRIARAGSWGMAGNFDALERDLTELAVEAELTGDDAEQAYVLAELVNYLRIKGGIVCCREWAQTAVEAARRTRRPELQVVALYARGVIEIDLGELRRAQTTLAAAEALLTPADVHGRMRTAILRAYLALRMGDHVEAGRCADEGLHLARANSWPIWESFSLNLLAIAEADLARRGLLLEDYRAVVTRLGDLPNLSVALFNLSGWYLAFGMFDQAVDLAEQALHIARSMRMDIASAFPLQTLGLALCAQGNPSAALARSDEGIALAHEHNHPLMEGLFHMLRGLALLCLGETQLALAALHAAEHVLPVEPPLYTANRLAYTALAACLAGDRTGARELAAEAVSLIKPEDYGNPEWAIEEFYWYCYRALVADPPAKQAPTLSSIQWKILDQGRQALLAPVEKLSDVGLRRSYLHRPWLRRLLIYEWLQWAPDFAGPEAVAAFAAQVQRPGRLADIFRRLLAVGIRLNAQRDPSQLSAQIVDEVAELTGAERIALVIYAEDGQRHATKVSLPIPPPPVISGVETPALDAQAFLAEIEPFLAEASRQMQGFVRQINPDGALVDQRSVLLAPLLSKGRLVGLIYCDLTGCFGRFEVGDLDLLGVLANQSAVAVENADWSATLEQKVAERTDELAQLTSALQDANALLEQRVAARTAELAAALEQLENAARLKDEFMAAVSHELRTPLTGVLGMADALEMQVAGPLNERQLGYVQKIRESGKRQLSMVNSLLRYTDLLGGRVTVQQESCRLGELSAIAVRAARRRAEQKGQAVEFSLDPVEPVIVSDGDGIIQVLQQLFDNAVKFTPEGGRIGLEVRRDGRGDSVHLVVWDTGIGISAEQMATIFKPFVQADASLARAYGGVGLGLAFVHRMVELLGGTIAVESRRGKGSRFTVTLPVVWRAPVA